MNKKPLNVKERERERRGGEREGVKENSKYIEEGDSRKEIL